MRTLIVDNGDCNCETCQISRGIRGIKVTPEMIRAYDEAEEAAPGNWYDQTRAGLRAALEAAGFTVAESTETEAQPSGQATGSATGGGDRG